MALLLSTNATSIFSIMVQAMMSTLAASSEKRLRGLTNYRRDCEAQLVHTLLGGQPDTFVLTRTDHSAATRERLLKTDVPMVEIWYLSVDTGSRIIDQEIT